MTKNQLTKTLLKETGLPSKTKAQKKANLLLLANLIDLLKENV